MATLFQETICDWATWGRVFQSIPAFTPLLQEIYRREGLPFPGAAPCAPGTNAVFRVGDTIAKLFVPAESGMDSAPDYQTELFGLDRAQRLGLPAPRLLAAGQLQDRYLFRYLLLERIEGGSLAAYGPRLSGGQKTALGRQLREAADLLNTPCPPFNGADPVERAFTNRRWRSFPTSFNEERLRWIGEYSCPERVFVHGDLNPDNLLLRPDGRLCIIDFADALLAPRVYEHTLVACEFHFERPWMEGYFGAYTVEGMADLCLEGLLLHDFGPGILRSCLGDPADIGSLAVLRARLRAAVEKGLDG